MEAPSASTGMEPRLFAVDQGGERGESNLRLWAAGIAACSGLWLFAQGGGMVMAGIALSAIAFAMIWTMGWVRERVEHFQIDQRYLQLYEEGLSVSDGRMITSLTWDEVSEVWVDQDRLHVCVGLREGEPLRLDAPYQGVTPDGLSEIIQDYLSHAKACSADADV